MGTEVIFSLLAADIIFGGLQSVAKTFSKIVPGMTLLCFMMTVTMLLLFADAIPEAVMLIPGNAFAPAAASGGFLRATVLMVCRAALPAGASPMSPDRRGADYGGIGEGPGPAERGLVSMMSTFIDTIIICTLTGLTIISGQWMTDMNGAVLTSAAFSIAYPVIGNIILTFCRVLFEFTTILG